MQDVLDAISKLLKQPWEHQGAVDPADLGTIYYLDSAAAWEITYILSKRFLWILGRPLDRSGHPIIDLQMCCASVRESEVHSFQDGKVTVMGKVVVLHSPGAPNHRSETWMYFWPDGRLEVNVCIGGESESGSLGTCV